MTIKQAANVLRIHNQWRRGECDQTLQQDPRAIGEAIDKAIEVMESKLKREPTTQGGRDKERPILQ